MLASIIPRRTLSTTQISLLVMVGLLVVVVQILILRTYFNSVDTATKFEEKSFLTTSLANIQREALLLQLETQVTLQDPNPDTESLKLRRALLANQLRLQFSQSASNTRTISALNRIQNTLSEYDELLKAIERDNSVGRKPSTAVVYELLSELEVQIKTLYDREELSFFGAFRTTLSAQRSAQILLFAVDGVVAVLGVALAASLARTVRALKAENAERDRAAAALREANEGLEIRVDERTRELSAANEQLRLEVSYRAKAQKDLKAFATKLESSNGELQDFASIAAHDLQEPLRKVQAFGDRLKTKYVEALGEQGKDYVERMLDASSRMSGLINDLLLYSRVTIKAKPFERVDLNKVAREVVSDLEIRIEQVEGRVDIGDLPVIDADPMQMRQLLQNLIGNALKYRRMDEAPEVKLSAELLNGLPSKGEAQQEQDCLCQIVVEDNGIGFDEKHVDRIFGIFQRLHGRNEYEGTGVGLAICRKIAERHNGKITAKSEVNKGSTFTVTLPTTQPQGEEAE